MCAKMPDIQKPSKVYMQCTILGNKIISNENFSIKLQEICGLYKMFMIFWDTFHILLRAVYNQSNVLVLRSYEN